MTGLIIWKDQEIGRLKRDIDRIFRRCYRDLRVPMAPLVPDTPYRTELSETPDALILTATLPGIDREDIHITVTGNTLTLEAKSADQTVDETSEYRRVTDQAQRFFQNIRLPQLVDTDRIEASFTDDLLKITMPKFKPRLKEGISIQVS